MLPLRGRSKLECGHPALHLKTNRIVPALLLAGAAAGCVTHPEPLAESEFAALAAREKRLHSREQ